MSVVTKTGDGGMTGYFENRISKASELIEAVGSLDELQAVCGFVKLEKIQKDLHGIMGNLGKGRPAYANFGEVKLETRIKEIEKEIKAMEKKIKVLSKFLIFKKDKAVKLNWVRTVVRRAERMMVKLETRNQKLDKNIKIYLNRLSDFIYLKALEKELK